MKISTISLFNLNRVDYLLISIIPILALSLAAFCTNVEALFAIILKLNVIFLGYHHVIATFTRISFSKKDYQQNKFLTWPLMLIVIAAVTAIIFFVGEWIIASIYFYWQWFHYTRQSYGIAKKYQKQNKEIPISPLENKIHYGALYLLPLAGILYRSYQNSSTFLSMQLKTFTIPESVWLVTFALAVIFIVLELGLWVYKSIKGKVNTPFICYMISHHIIFGVGYLVIENLDYGWLCINIWHNAQYLVFVWYLNHLRFKNGVQKGYSFISGMSQLKNKSDYIWYCLGISTFVYGALTVSAQYASQFTTLPLIVIIFMTINFHHYIVDGIIWKGAFIKKLNKL